MSPTAIRYGEQWATAAAEAVVTVCVRVRPVEQDGAWNMTLPQTEA